MQALATAMTMALRRPTLANDSNPGVGDHSTPTTSSSAPRLVRFGPTMKSASGTRRIQVLEDAVTTCAP
jgi:hypothetical protein